MSGFSETLNKIRTESRNDVELGSAFEQISKVFLENDDIQSQEYSEVWHYTDWAKNRSEYSNIDIGIDLVAKLKREEGFCAIQCKCYESDHSVSKADLDSFISASSTEEFTRLMLIDTSIKPISKNAQTVFDNLSKEFVRVQTSDLNNSRINWNFYSNENEVSFHQKKKPLDHQIQAIDAVEKYFQTADRGKLIMACGTGKTFTSLKIAEKMLGPGKLVLYMVPSLSLMSQTISEWKKDCSEEFIAFSACSDKKVGKRKKTDDVIDITLNDLAFPATTDPFKLSNQLKKLDKSKMIVVFSTYHSINVISDAQSKYELDAFDLIICDEAHRTTGATLSDEDESNFVKIHSNENVNGKKRLYMTATPRIYGDKAKKKEEEGLITLASMNDESIFGKIIFQRGFSWAVENNLLSDYKVIVLVMDEKVISDRLQQSFTDGNELALDDATKIVGCYKALAKIGLDKNNSQETLLPMKRALAFCQNIKLSKVFSQEFKNVVDDYLSNEKIKDKEKLIVQTSHIDGSFNAEERNTELAWLKEDTPENTCRVISNARCLSEGVDVPSLDAIIFAHPRSSQIEIVQSVGRVMRKAKGKEIGYVILPIAVAPGVTAKRALDDNERYRVIWQILNALRAHDERFNSTINAISLGEDVSHRLEIIDGTSREELEATTAVVDDVKSKKRKKTDPDDGSSIDNGSDEKKNNEEQLTLNVSDLSTAIKAKIVQKCGTRDYWENWANDIASIAEKHITRINSIVLNSGTKEREAFLKFLEEIQDDLNPDVSETDAVEMIAQHIITKPVFDSLFAGNKFTEDNSLSKSMETLLSEIYNYKIDTETRSLEKFYKSVQIRCKDVVTSAGRQKLIVELYDRFFRKAFPLMTQKLGLVYTPIEVVDFIINSTEYLMNSEFQSSLSNENVNVLDPFTGTGTFISRLLQSGIFSIEQLKQKFNSEIHANEIILLAYYIACINIESVYSDLVSEDSYTSFKGIVLTDTFQMYEQERDMIANLLPDNSKRRTNQKNKKFSVIFGNPPYSVGQKSSNDDAKNNEYTNLDARINETYVSLSKATNKRALYDSYIRAFRWASDRIQNEGIIGFVSGGAWIDRQFGDGMRLCLKNEFSKIYVLNLRGDIRKNMMSKGAAGEGENIFGQGSMNGISITFLVKKEKNDDCQIYYADIGDNLKIDQKKDFLIFNKSIENLIVNENFLRIKPDKNNDWLEQRNENFSKFLPLGNKKDKSELTIFDDYSMGIGTSRDAWCFNFSQNQLSKNIQKTIAFYNEQLSENIPFKNLKKDSSKIKWSSTLESFYKRGEKINFDEEEFYIASFKPFIKTNLYRETKLVHRISKMKKIFPKNKQKNLAIGISGVGSRSEFSVLMTDVTSSMDCLEKSQYFPLYLYEEDMQESNQKNLFSVFNKKEIKKPAISKNIVDLFSKSHPNLNLTYEDIFYFIYAVLHSKEYRKNYKNNLKKELPRIPVLSNSETFKIYIDSGRKLANLHVNYESVEKYNLNCEFQLGLDQAETNKKFYVEKMKFNTSNKMIDKTKIIVNKYITLSNIPLAAYEYTLSNRSAIELVMDRYCSRKDSASGIYNDPNDYAIECLGNPKYPVELIQRIVTVSMETIKIINSLPKLEI